MDEKIKNDELMLIAGKIRDECINTALEAFATATGDGVCCTGAWECAIDAIRNLDAQEIINRLSRQNKNINHY
jgi:hypothetical protein